MILSFYGKTVNIMTRNLILIANACFRGYGCSGCGWVFIPSGPLVGNTLEEMKRLYESERDKEFREHACADHPRATGLRKKVSCL
jgi:hypothetical protein